VAEHLLALRGSQKGPREATTSIEPPLQRSNRHDVETVLRHLERALQTGRGRHDICHKHQTGRMHCGAPIYLSAKEDDDAATQDLHEALLSTVIAQLAAPDTGRYQGTVKNIILAAATPRGQPTLRPGNNLAVHFLRLSINTPLPNLPESARQFALSIIREQASITPDSDWTKAAKIYNLTTIPKITMSSHTVLGRNSSQRPSPNPAQSSHAKVSKEANPTTRITQRTAENCQAKQEESYNARRTEIKKETP